MPRQYYLKLPDDSHTSEIVRDPDVPIMTFKTGIELQRVDASSPNNVMQAEQIQKEDSEDKGAASKEGQDSSSKVQDVFESKRERDDALHNIRSYLWLKDFESKLKLDERCLQFLSELLGPDSDASSGEDGWKSQAEGKLKTFFNVGHSDEIETKQISKTFTADGIGDIQLQERKRAGSDEGCMSGTSSSGTLDSAETVEKGSDSSQLAVKVSDHSSEYKDVTNYGDMYSCLLEMLGESLSRSNIDTYTKGIIAKAVYRNSAPILMLREKDVNDLEGKKEEEFNSSEIRKNHSRPAHQESLFIKAHKNFLRGELHYQQETNMPVVLEYMKQRLGLDKNSTLPTLIRCGMQVNRVRRSGQGFFESSNLMRESRGNSIFDAYVKGLPEDGVHLYLNFLDKNKDKCNLTYSENDMLAKLVRYVKEESQGKVLLVSLPSTQGKLAEICPSTSDYECLQTFKDKLNGILKGGYCKEKNFNIKQEGSGLRCDDKGFSVRVASGHKCQASSKASGSAPEAIKIIFDDLINQSCEFIISESRSVVTPAQEQAIMFHLFSYALPKAILKLHKSPPAQEGGSSQGGKRIASMNFTCKSGIDRGWKAQLYFLIAEYVCVQCNMEGENNSSIVSETILNFIEDFVDSAAYAVRGRAMNAENRGVFFNVIKAMATSGKLGELLRSSDESVHYKVDSDFLGKLEELRQTKNLCNVNGGGRKPSSCSIM